MKFALLVILLLILLVVVLPIGINFILRSRSQTIKWEAGFMLASAIALAGYVRIQTILGPPLPVHFMITWLLKIIAVLSPTLLAVAFLRWSSIKWIPALLLFPLVPLGMLTLWIMNQFPFAS